METKFLNQIAIQNFTEGARDADLQQDAVVYNLKFKAVKNIL